jgi:two-component system chemotaxis response regulator CheB
MNRLIVIGASAGGVSALERLAASLPETLAAPVLVVLHVGAHPSALPEVLSYRGRLPAEHAHDGQSPEPGRIYVAPPDHHMLVVDNSLRLNRGPKEHHARPAIDPLFLSAALARGPEVIGVVLTGMLDDGTFGLQAIKRCGGTAVVQDPADAVEPSMPLSALRHVDVDHCVPLDEMAELLVDLASTPPSTAVRPRDQRLQHEQHVMLFDGRDAMEHLSAIATPSPFVCPDCHGGLWEIADSDPVRYRCHVGHGFSIRTLQHELWGAADDSIWDAIRALQEKSQLILRMAELHKASGDERGAAALETTVKTIQEQANGLRLLVEKTPLPVE